MERRMAAPQSQYGHWRRERSLAPVRNEHPLIWSSRLQPTNYTAELSQKKWVKMKSQQVRIY
jgi:hypothetical protein